jgi:hypothetical protein
MIKMRTITPRTVAMLPAVLAALCAGAVRGGAGVSGAGGFASGAGVTLGAGIISPAGFG